jgi:hypothetical protein
MLNNTITNSTELNKMDRYNILSYSNGENLEKAIKEFGKLVISYPDAWAMVHTVNDNPKPGQDEEYDKLVIIADGILYHTGSQSFTQSFLDIVGTFDASDDMEIECFAKPSQNYKGRNFLGCRPVAKAGE